jgi:Cu2+-exporting ATPase
MQLNNNDKHEEHIHMKSDAIENEMDHSQHNRHTNHKVHEMEHPNDHEGDHSGHILVKNHEANESNDGHGDHVDHTGHEEMFRKRFLVSTILSIPVLVFSSAIQDFLRYSIAEFPGSAWITPVVSVIVFLYGGVPFLDMARPEIKKRQPGMMTLISLAIGVAFVYSLVAQLFSLGTTFFWELVTLIDVMLLGHWLEMRSVRQASGALNELAKLMPDTAERIRDDGEIEQIQATALKNGDRILIRPGTSVPADGEIFEGESDLNESMITGESKPVTKSIGDPVIGGTINGNGSLRVKITAIGDDTALAGIMRLVKEAQSSKTDTQILADKAAGWLFYIAVGAAAITAVAWIFAIGFDVQIIARVATVLVIACPHALGLAVPLVVAITTAMGAKNGILVRDRLALEEARKVDTLIFDKTGTLTKGEFGVVEVAASPGIDENDVLALAAAIEGDSEHTIARGIRNKAEELEISLPDVSHFEAIKGRGVRAVSKGSKVYIGGPRLLEMLELTLPEHLLTFEETASSKGQSVVHVIREHQVVGSLALADVIREESQLAINKLHEMGIEVVMLTGDSIAVARAVAEELNIDQYFAEILPQDKDKKVLDLQQAGKLVAMVGDGVNDAPALTRADVGVAIGSGTDVAVESAGLILVKSNPLDVVKIFSLSQASYRKMIQNLAWATGYNMIALPLAAGVLAPFGILLSPAVGALFMSLSTVIVAINAQLLRKQL